MSDRVKFLKDKVVWITGASSGIGKELALQMNLRGSFIIASSRNREKLEAVRNESSFPENFAVLPLDLEKSETFKEKTAEALKIKYRIDVLINNGGISQRAEACKTDLEIDRKIMEVNYFGNIALTKAVLPIMQKQKSGNIIVISSIAGKFGFYLRSAYAASKHALQGFYESLRLEEEKNNIKVLLVYPGKINTPISLSALDEKGESHNQMDENQATGMAVEKCAHNIINAVVKDKKEILVGGKEIKAVLLKRFLPKLFYKVIKKQKAT